MLARTRGRHGFTQPKSGLSPGRMGSGHPEATLSYASLCVASPRVSSSSAFCASVIPCCAAW